VSKEQRLRQQLEWIMARHDTGAMSPAMAATVKAIQCDIAWQEHKWRSASSQNSSEGQLRKKPNGLPKKLFDVSPEPEKAFL
jgi:hypothetical protein